MASALGGRHLLSSAADVARLEGARPSTHALEWLEARPDQRVGVRPASRNMRGQQPQVIMGTRYGTEDEPQPLRAAPTDPPAFVLCPNGTAPHPEC